MKVIFKDNIKSYLLIFLLSIIAGLSVVFFCEFPNNDLWAFSYWSSETFGFWMFSTSLIVLLSEKRKTATTNSTIYIFVMFLITTIYKSFRLYLNGYTPFNSLIDLSLNSMFDMDEIVLEPNSAQTYVVQFNKVYSATNKAQYLVLSDVILDYEEYSKSDDKAYYSNRASIKVNY